MRKFLLSALNGCEIKLSDDWPNSAFHVNNNNIIFEYNSKNGNFLVDYKTVWSVFYDKFGLSYDETQAFIKSVVEDTLKLNSLIPRRYVTIDRVAVEETLILNSLIHDTKFWQMLLKWCKLKI